MMNCESNTDKASTLLSFERHICCCYCYIPTGNARDTIQGIDVSIVDAANLILLIPAEQLGLRGTEREEVFQPGSDFMIHLESIRREAGMLAGMGDVSESVLPRIAILSAASSAVVMAEGTGGWVWMLKSSSSSSATSSSSSSVFLTEKQ